MAEYPRRDQVTRPSNQEATQTVFTTVTAYDTTTLYTQVSTQATASGQGSYNANTDALQILLSALPTTIIQSIESAYSTTFNIESISTAQHQTSLTATYSSTNSPPIESSVSPSDTSHTTTQIPAATPQPETTRSSIFGESTTLSPLVSSDTVSFTESSSTKQSITSEAVSTTSLQSSKGSDKHTDSLPSAVSEASPQSIISATEKPSIPMSSSAEPTPHVPASDSSVGARPPLTATVSTWTTHYLSPSTIPPEPPAGTSVYGPHYSIIPPSPVVTSPHSLSASPTSFSETHSSASSTSGYLEPTSASTTSPTTFRTSTTVAGAISGSAAGAVLLALLAIYLFRRRRNSSQPPDSGSDTSSVDRQSSTRSRAYPEIAWLYDPAPTPPRHDISLLKGFQQQIIYQHQHKNSDEAALLPKPPQRSKSPHDAFSFTESPRILPLRPTSPGYIPLSPSTMASSYGREGSPERHWPGEPPRSRTDSATGKPSNGGFSLGNYGPGERKRPLTAIYEDRYST